MIPIEGELVVLSTLVIINVLLMAAIVVDRMVRNLPRRGMQ